MTTLKALKNTDKSDEGVKMDILHPRTGEVLTCDVDGSEMWIKMVGLDSKRYKNALRAQQLKMKAGRKPSDEEVEQNSIALLGQLVVDWNVQLEGEAKDELTAEKATEVFMEYKWIRDDALRLISDRANFFEVLSIK